MQKELYERVRIEKKKEDYKKYIKGKKEKMTQILD